MSFYTSLTGLNAASAQLGVTSNNIANVGTIGFKRSRAEFGDIFATSPLQKASAVIGQGVILKEVTQEFSQGNIEFSSNSLDMAIAGQGFFALKPNLTSNQTVFTRNGAFMVNNDRYVVDSAGQFLQVFPVNDDGSVIATGIQSARSLQLPETAGLPKPSSTIELGLNLPADADIIPKRDRYQSGEAVYRFDRTDPDTYNKSTSITVYDSLGNPAIATIYYVKTQNATVADPTNKWQTYIYVGDREILPALIPSRNDKGEQIYMDKFGQFSTNPADPNTPGYDPAFNPSAAHPKYNLDDQSIRVPSQRGSFTGGVMQPQFDFGSTDTNPLVVGSSTAFTAKDFAVAGATSSGIQLPAGTPLFEIRVDGSNWQQISLPSDGQYTGTELARELTKSINDVFGDERYFDVQGDNRKFTMNVGTASATGAIDIEIDAGDKYTPQSLVAAIQAKIDAATVPVAMKDKLKVDYDVRTRSLVFKPTDTTVRTLQIIGPQTGTGATATRVPNELLGFGSSSEIVEVGPSEKQAAFSSSTLLPNGELRLAEDQHRYGIQVEYLRDERKFAFFSGTTGEASSIELRAIPVANPANALLDKATARAAEIFGFDPPMADQIITTVGSGLPSLPAVTVGSRAGIDISGTFVVRAEDNQNRIAVTVDGIEGQVLLPTGAYTGNTFAAALERQINLIESPDGRKVAGVTVTYNAEAQNFTFRSATTSANSFINVNGHPNWGLAQTTQSRGEVPAVTVLRQARDADGNLLYIDADGNETTKAPSGDEPKWTPVYLDKGELTFDTSGRLISPKEGAKYTPFDPQNGADPIVLNVDYGRNSTQFSAPFSVLSLKQDGFPSGRLDGLDIDSSGVVRANYTNGQQVALGKIILANFANPNGLKQIGDANFLQTTNSGEPTLGEAGADGFGTIQGGARERANVDLTQELVELITAQRNFQANAKAIETSTSLTQTIINIRS